MQKYKEFDFESLNLIKSFVLQKIEDAAVVVEALAIFSFFLDNDSMKSSETASICIK